MNNKKGLIVAAVVLVLVVAGAAALYGNLSQGQKQNPAGSLLGGSSNAESTLGTASSDDGSMAAVEETINEAASATGAGSSAPMSDAGEAAADSQASSGSAPVDAGPIQLADFAVQDKDGNEVKLSSTLGKPTLLGFWATWCPPCNAEAPELQKLYEEYGDRINFMMVDVANDGRDTVEGTLEWIAEGGYSYPVYYDTSGDASTECQIYYLPTMFVLDSQGNVLTAFSGALDEESGEELIGQMLAYEEQLL